MKYLIERCAELHTEHIGSGDPFELGSSRPLDFGHWSAHKLEQLSNFEVLHGEAVSLGIALDCAYSYLDGRISREELEAIIFLLKRCKLPITHKLIQIDSLEHPIFRGLEEFREHLGGQLTIMLLQKIGKGIEVHELDHVKVMQAAQLIKNEF
jgi:3-dehydroquinate synthase